MYKKNAELIDELHFFDMNPKVFIVVECSVPLNSLCNSLLFRYV